MSNQSSNWMYELCTFLENYYYNYLYRPAPSFKILYPVKSSTVPSSQPAVDPSEKVMIRSIVCISLA